MWAVIQRHQRRRSGGTEAGERAGPLPHARRSRMSRSEAGVGRGGVPLHLPALALARVFATPRHSDHPRQSLAGHAGYPKRRWRGDVPDGKRVQQARRIGEQTQPGRGGAEGRQPRGAGHPAPASDRAPTGRPYSRAKQNPFPAARQHAPDADGPERLTPPPPARSGLRPDTPDAANGDRPPSAQASRNVAPATHSGRTARLDARRGSNLPAPFPPAPSPRAGAAEAGRGPRAGVGTTGSGPSPSARPQTFGRDKPASRSSRPAASPPGTPQSRPPASPCRRSPPRLSRPRPGRTGPSPAPSSAPGSARGIQRRGGPSRGRPPPTVRRRSAAQTPAQFKAIKGRTDHRGERSA